MEINVLDWSEDQVYYKHDVVRVPHIYDQQKGDSIVIDFNTPQNENEKEIHTFDVSGKFGYTATVALKKIFEDTKSKDNYKTHLKQIEEESTNIVDPSESIGIGIGVKFLDEQGKLIKPNDPRDFIRLMGTSEIDHVNTIKAAIEVPDRSVPKGAKKGVLSIYGLGLKRGGISFTRIQLRNYNTYFYCTEDHKPSPSNHPNKSGQKYWTQRFFWRPSYNSSVSFDAKIEKLPMGDGNEFTTSDGLNALPIEVTVRFDNRTDREAKAIAHFFQEKAFMYDSMFSIDYKGERTESGEMQSFEFDIGLPYKDGLMFTCTDFTHTIEYRNNHTLQAKLECNTVSVLENIQGSAGYNDRQDAIFPVVINGLRAFAPDRITRLDTFQLEPDENGGFSNDLARVGKHFEGTYLKEHQSYLDRIGIFSDDYVTLEDDDINILTTDKQWWNFAINLKFNKPQTFEVGDLIYLHSNLHPDSIFSVGLIYIAEVKSDTEFITENMPFQPENLNLTDAVIQENGYDGGTPDFLFQKLIRHPLDCMGAKLILPDGVDKINHLIKNEITGEYEKRKIISRDYRTFFLEKDILPEDYYIYLSSEKEYEVVGPFDFPVLVPEIRGKSSMYIKNSEFILEYPWKSTRDFDYRPTMAFTVGNTPKHLETKFLKNFDKKYKKGINSNLVALNLTFEQRSDEEAAAIILFLESHLGYKRFSFDMPRPYIAGQNNNIVDEVKGIHAFYCPSWSHDMVYKNNHTITATFIESKTANLFEDAAGTLDACLIGGSIHDPFVSHATCTLSSSAVCYPQSGLRKPNISGDAFQIFPKTKEVDIVFVIDALPALSEQKLKIGNKEYTKFELILDSIRKMAVGYDTTKFPATYNVGIENTAQLFIDDNDRSGDKNVPPWPVVRETNVLDGSISEVSLIMQNYNPDPTSQQILTEVLEGYGYNTENLKRFNLNITERGVNIGISLVGDKIMDVYPMDKDRDFTDPLEVKVTDKRLLDLPDYPSSFDKHTIYNKIGSFKLQGGRGKNHLQALSDAVTQMFNAQRANVVDERIIFFISDFYFNGSDEDEIIKIRDALKVVPDGKGGSIVGDLARRRPLDIVLKKYGTPTLDEYMSRYAYTESWRQEGNLKYSNLFNPDFTGMFSSKNFIFFIKRTILSENPSMSDGEAQAIAEEQYNSIDPDDLLNPLWYSKPINTLFFPIGVGSTGEISPDFDKFANDYTPDKPSKDLEFKYRVSDVSPFNEEAFRITNIAKIVQSLTEDTGFQNVFSVTLMNCGPNDIKIHNTIAGFDKENGLCSWTTEALKYGIAKNDDPNNLEYHEKYKSSKDEPLRGSGGQYYGDTNNEKLLYEDPSQLIWHSFNTEYEVYRRGEVHEINGGWGRDKAEFILTTDDGNSIITNDYQPTIQDKLSAKNMDINPYEVVKTEPVYIGPVKTKGVQNTGVAFKGMRVRVFKSNQQPIEIIDYNIGNAIEANQYKGDYNHLPILKRGESIDLFFGIRAPELEFFNRKFQLFFNTEDLKDTRMDCSAQVEIQINIDKSRNVDKVLKGQSGICMLNGAQRDDLNTKIACEAAGGEWVETLSEEDVAKNSAEIISLPTVPELTPSFDGLCDPHGVLARFANEFQLGFGQFPHALLWSQLQYDEWESNYTNRANSKKGRTDSEWLNLYKYYNPFGIDPTEFIELKNTYSCCYKSNWYPLDQYHNYRPGEVNAPGYYVGAALIGRNNGSRWRTDSGVLDRAKKWSMPPTTHGVAKYINDTNLPTWFPEFLKDSKPWEVRYEYSDNGRYGPGRTDVVFKGLDYRLIKNVQQFYDVMFLELYFWHVLANQQKGLLWKNGSKYYGQPTDAENLNYFVQNAAWAMGMSVNRCKDEIFGIKCVDHYDVSWKYSCKHNYKNTIFNWFCNNGWSGTSDCPGGVRHENSTYYKNKLAGIYLGKDDPANDPQVFISSKAVGMDYEVSQNFFVSKPYDQGIDPEEKLFGPWGITIPLKKDNTLDVIDENICPRVRNVKLFAEHRVPYDHIQSIVANAPIRVRLRNSGYPEECRCSADRDDINENKDGICILGGKDRPDLRTKDQCLEAGGTWRGFGDGIKSDQILFDGIGPFVLESLESYIRTQNEVGDIELPPVGEEWRWSTDGYNQDPAFWDRYGIDSGKQFFGAYGLYNATHIKINYLGPEFVTFDRYENEWVIKRLPNDFCYDRDGNMVQCYEQYSQKNKNALNQSEKIITTLKPGSFHYSEVDWKNPKSVQYGYAANNRDLINPRIYVDFRSVPDPGADPSPVVEEAEGIPEEAEFVFETATLEGANKLRDCLAMPGVVVDTERAKREAVAGNNQFAEQIKANPYLLLLKTGNALAQHWIQCLTDYTNDYGEEGVPWWVKTSPFNKPNGYKAESLGLDMIAQVNEVNGSPDLDTKVLYGEPTYIIGGVTKYSYFYKFANSENPTSKREDGQ